MPKLLATINTILYACNLGRGNSTGVENIVILRSETICILDYWEKSRLKPVLFVVRDVTLITSRQGGMVELNISAKFSISPVLLKTLLQSSILSPQDGFRA